MKAYLYFDNHDIVVKKKYDALRDFFYHKKKAKIVADTYGYTLFAFYSLVRDFKKHLNEKPDEEYFFKSNQLGRKPKSNTKQLDEMIINLRKQNYSAEDILTIVHAKGMETSYGYVYQLLQKEGFARLLRRSKEDRTKLEHPKIKAPIADQLQFEREAFETNSAGIFIFLPYIKQYKIDQAIKDSNYPETAAINRLSSILSFVLLKLSNIRRYSTDDLWCMDRGLGLAASLNVLPKNAWLSSYSSRITREMNHSFLKRLHKIWQDHSLLSDTSNLDFTTIPYWGDDEHYENNWSGKRNKALSSMLAILAQDPDNGIIDYGDTNIMHENEHAVVLEYLDFYQSTPSGRKELKYLVFDSKFTNYENLAKLNSYGIKFVTIRRRGCRILERIRNMKPSQWVTKRVEAAGLKKRTLKVFEEKVKLQGYCDCNTGQIKDIRQIIITGHGRIKPAVLITNDFELSIDLLIRKYCRRWLVEKGISEQVEFFHLNRVNSSMVIKVDFDLTMSILAHNLYRLLSQDLERYSHLLDQKIYDKFINNSGRVKIENDRIIVTLKKKRDLPQILELMNKFEKNEYEWLDNKSLEINVASSS